MSEAWIRGIIDFPYMAPNGKEYFLCWHFGEEDLYYFHEIYKDLQRDNPLHCFHNNAVYPKNLGNKYFPLAERLSKPRLGVFRYFRSSGKF